MDDGQRAVNAGRKDSRPASPHVPGNAGFGFRGLLITGENNGKEKDKQ